MMKKLLILIIISFILVCDVNAKQITVEDNMESIIMLDVARRYYTVDEIKTYIDALSQNKNSSLQLHLSDNENVGIECTYLDQTVDNATYSNGVYTNPKTNKKFLSYNQVREILSYAKEKGVRIIPEIDVPAHMNGFFTLAIEKFGYDYVRNPYDWSNPENSGIAWGSGDEIGHIDLKSPNAKPFIKALMDEYSDFFSDLEYFHIGFDEYTFRPEEKISYANELATYLENKGFKVRMWSDAITKTNIDDLKNTIEITFWGYKNGDILTTEYATVPDLQEHGFKVIITNKYYLFFVPSISNVDQYSLDYTIEKIRGEWDISKWNYDNQSTLDTNDNILGAMVCSWGEDSAGVSNDIISTQTISMYNAMFLKLDKITRTVDVSDEENASSDETKIDEPTTVETSSINNPRTNDNVVIYFVISIVSISLYFVNFIYKKLSKI